MYIIFFGLIGTAILAIFNLFPYNKEATNSYIEYCKANDIVFGEQIDFGLFETEFMEEPPFSDKKRKFYRGKDTIGKAPKVKSQKGAI